jgi:glyoxylase-like metal-dependent hydrolase (beta-lactamase superfamily II)
MIHLPACGNPLSKLVDYPSTDLPEEGTIHEVATGLYWVRMPLPLILNHINLWLADDGDSWTIIDTGLKDDRIKELWDQIFGNFLDGKPVKRVIVTHMHPDHVGLAGWICEKFDAELTMSRTDWIMGRLLSTDAPETPPQMVFDFYSEMGLPEEHLDILRKQGYGNFAKGVYPMPVTFNRARDGGRFQMAGSDWVFMEGQGHSPEHMCLYCEDRGILIAGDQILPRISPIIGVYPGEPRANPLDDYLESLKTFKVLPSETYVLPAHGLPFYRLKERIDELTLHHEERLDAILEGCATATPVWESLPWLFRRKMEGSTIFMALAEAQAHFNMLEIDGRLVREIGDDGVHRFRTVEKATAAA